MLRFVASFLTLHWAAGFLVTQPLRLSKAGFFATVGDSLAVQPADGADFFKLASALVSLDASPITISQLTDAIESQKTITEEEKWSWLLADLLRRTRRRMLLADLLRADRRAYVETVSFLTIPRNELPNLQDIPIRECDADQSGGAPVINLSAVQKDPMTLTTDGLVPDCALGSVAMGENPLEALLLRITRDIYTEKAGIPRIEDKTGIPGLLEEMRIFMLSPKGNDPARQQRVLLDTLYVLMTPILPPFYRIFMGGIIPSSERGDPKWLVDGCQQLARVVASLPFIDDNDGEAFKPGVHLGPLPYAPLLTALVAPFAFGFLVGPSRVNLRSDGQLGGLVVDKCKFLQESNCKGMCLNSCKLPAQQLFDELGLPLRVMPNFVTQECQWSFGESSPPPEEDPTWPQGCIVGCTSRAAMKELSAATVTADGLGGYSDVPACK